MKRQELSWSASKNKIAPGDLAAIEQPISRDKQAEPQPNGVMMPDPVYQNLTSQLQEVKTEIDIRERERKLIESEIEKYNQRVQNTPQSEQEIAEVVRQNADLTKQYEKLKSDFGTGKTIGELGKPAKGIPVYDRGPRQLSPRPYEAF